MRISLLIFLCFLSSCKVGPDYAKPAVEIPESYKEIDKNWKTAEPNDAIDRGPWWEVFQDQHLNILVTQLNVSNQNIAAVEAQYRQARALVDQAKAGYSPTLTGSSSIMREKQNTTTSNKPLTNYAVVLDAAWEPDLWGSVHHSVEASEAGAEATLALVGSTRLAAQASLAQYYFELRTLDKVQNILDENVTAYKDLLEITHHRYKMGMASLLNIVQLQGQLQTAEIQATDNGINRAQYEHAIAVLIGKPPSSFSLPPAHVSLASPVIPLQVPSRLLERRLDVAQAERLMAQANAQIGVAITAPYPTLNLTASGGFSSSSFAQWFSLPSRIWSLGPQLAATLFDGGLLKAKTDAACASYDQSVASYRQTVLTAFQDVEDNLASLRLLELEEKQQTEVVASFEIQLKLTRSEYQSGTNAFSDVIAAQIGTYSAKQQAIIISGRRMNAAIGLIKALGGGWNAEKLS